MPRVFIGEKWWANLSVESQHILKALNPAGPIMMFGDIKMTAFMLIVFCAFYVKPGFIRVNKKTAQ